MSRFIPASVEEHNASTSLSLSFSNHTSLTIPQWLADQAEVPLSLEPPGFRKKELTNGPPTPPMSCVGPKGLPDERSEEKDTVGCQTPRTSSPASPGGSIPGRPLYLLTPPESQAGGDIEDSLDLSYPLKPRPLSQCRLSPLPGTGGSGQPIHRVHAIANSRSASSASPDRYISNRSSPQDSARTFRLGKPPHLLSESEKLLRRDSATPDPFVSGSPKRIRQGRSLISANPNRSSSRSQSRSASNPDVLTISHPALPFPQLRQASVGAVWNVGGGSTHPIGPIHSVSDGRGGLIGSGTNAPLYTAKFLEKGALDQDTDAYENRLAAALDIDRTRRTLEFSRPQGRGRQVSGTKRKRADFVGRTQWKYGEWIREGDISRKPQRDT